MTIHTNTIRVYDLTLQIDTESTDAMQRNTFIAYATSEAEKLKQEFKKLMVKEYDERTNPVRPDTVVS